MNVSSVFTVTNTEKEGLIDNLTCMATSLDKQPLTATMELQPCHASGKMDKEKEIVAILISERNTRIGMDVNGLSSQYYFRFRKCNDP